MGFRPGRLWALSFAAFFLMIAAWAVAAPYDAAGDEHEHLYRAAGVASGQIAPKPEVAVRGGGAFQTVPAGIVHKGYCWHWHLRVSAACGADRPNGDRTPTRIGSGAGRYHPAYYAAVGLPLKLWPSWFGLYLSRLISGALAAALLAGAVVAIVRHTRRRLMLAGLLVALTPTSLHFLGSVNPNALEIAAGIAFFAAVIPLALGRPDADRPDTDRPDGGPPPDGVPRDLLVLAGISAIALSMLRPTGLLVLATAAAAFLLPLRRDLLLRLWRSTAVRWWAAALVLAAGTAVLWSVVQKSAEFGPYYKPADPMTRGQAVIAVAQKWGEWLEQVIAIFNWTETHPPQPVYLVWELAGFGLLLLAVIFGRWVDRWRLFAIFAGGVLVPSVMQTLYVNENGFITQGRYMLPVLVGLMLLSGYLLERRGLPAPVGRSLSRSFVVALLPVQFFCLVWVMARWQHGLPDYGEIGLSSLNPFTGEWHPPVGSATPLVAMIAGLGLLGWLTWRLTGVDGDERTEPAGETGDALAGRESDSGDGRATELALRSG